MNETEQLIDEISIKKFFKYDHNGVYLEAKQRVVLLVYERSFLEYFSQLCTKELSLNYLDICLPISNQEEFLVKLKAFFGIELVHVSALVVL